MSYNVYDNSFCSHANIFLKFLVVWDANLLTSIRKIQRIVEIGEEIVELQEKHLLISFWKRRNV